MEEREKPKKRVKTPVTKEETKPEEQKKEGVKSKERKKEGAKSKEKNTSITPQTKKAQKLRLGKKVRKKHRLKIRIGLCIGIGLAAGAIAAVRAGVGSGADPTEIVLEDGQTLVVGQVVSIAGNDLVLALAEEAAAVKRCQADRG